MDPDHDAAWHYMRSVVNPRWVRDHTEELKAEEQKKSGGLFSCFERKEKYRLATSDEEHSDLVPIWGSTVEDLGMFGIGIGLYYKQILAFFWLSLIYGLLLIPMMRYYATTGYNNVYNDVVNGTAEAIPFMLQASAICTDYETVKVTVDCDSTTQNCKGYYADECTLLGKYGLYDFAALALLFLFCIYTGRLQAQQVEAIDIAQQTPQDYSVVVQDPDEDADNPDEWERFFRQFGEVAYITITRQNRKLVKALSKRRVVRHEIYVHGLEEEVLAGAGINGRGETAGLTRPKKPGLFARKDAAYWRYRLWEADQEVEAWAARDYPVGKVYAIFNEERGQRECLNALTTGKIPAALEIGRVPTEHRFRGTNVLEVEEPVEPSEVLWHNLEISPWTLFCQGALSAALTLLIVYVCYRIIVHLKEGDNVKATGIVVALLNSVLPVVLKTIVLLENHVDDGDRQDSLFAKLSAARFMNTAIINWVTTSFHSTLSLTSLKTIQSILISDAVITPTVSLLNLGGNFKIHVLGKFAKTHPKLMSYYTGVQWYLGERYTAYTKTFFVAAFYAALYPGGMFVAAFCFAYGYWVDKYMLLRVWKKPPQYDAQLAVQARAHIVFSALCHLLVTANWYYGWPFDDTVVTDTGAFSYQDKSPLTPGTPSTWYRFLYMEPQDWQNTSQQPAAAPPKSKRARQSDPIDEDSRRSDSSGVSSDEEPDEEPSNYEFLVLLYGHAALVLLALLALLYFGAGLWNGFMSLWVGDYEEVGDDQGIPFSSVDNIEAYVPLAAPPSNELAGPLVAAHCVNLLPRHYPDLQRKVFSDMNVAEEFAPGDARRLFGLVKGYAAAASPGLGGGGGREGGGGGGGGFAGESDDEEMAARRLEQKARGAGKGLLQATPDAQDRKQKEKRSMRKKLKEKFTNKFNNNKNTNNV